MKHSAALLVFQRRADGLHVFLVHPGGPFWARKDLGTWSIPKGEFAEDEDSLAAAKREFFEEVGQMVEGKAIALSPCPQPSRKMIHPWAIEGEVDETRVKSNEFEMEWPPRSGRRVHFPEVDRGRWFPLAEARKRLLPGQVPILDELAAKLKTCGRRSDSDRR